MCYQLQGSVSTSLWADCSTRRSVFRYMKYLYPQECQREGLSSPADLQAAIDGNRREGRRVGYSAPSYPDFSQRTPLIAR